MDGTVNLIDFKKLPCSSFSKKTTKDEKTGWIAWPDVFMLNSRYSICAARLKANQNSLHLIDMYFNRIVQTFQIKPIRKFSRYEHTRFAPRDEKSGIIYTGFFAYTVQLNLSAGRFASLISEPNTLKFRELKKVYNLRTSHLNLVLFVYYHQRFYHLSIRNWSTLEKETLNVRIPVQMYYDFQYYDDFVYPSFVNNQLLLIRYNQSLSERETIIFTPLLFGLTNLNNGELELIETHGFEELNAKEIEASGEWRSHTFICCAQLCNENKDTVSEIFLLNLLTKSWSRLCRPINTSIGLISHINPATEEPLIFFSFNRMLVDRYLRGETNRPRKVYRLPVSRPDSLTTLCRLIAFNRGIFKRRIETQNHLDQLMYENKKIAELKKSVKELKRKAVESNQKDISHYVPIGANFELPAFKILRKL